MSIRFFNRTRNLIFLAAVLIGLEELAVILVAFSPRGLIAYLGVYVTFGVFLAALAFLSLHINLGMKTPNPLLAWLYLHVLYWLFQTLKRTSSS